MRLCLQPEGTVSPKITPANGAGMAHRIAEALKHATSLHLGMLWRRENARYRENTLISGNVAVSRRRRLMKAYRQTFACFDDAIVPGQPTICKILFGVWIYENYGGLSNNYTISHSVPVTKECDAWHEERCR